MNARFRYARFRCRQCERAFSVDCGCATVRVDPDGITVRCHCPLCGELLEQPISDGIAADLLSAGAVLDSSQADTVVPLTPADVVCMLETLGDDRLIHADLLRWERGGDERDTTWD